jgi:hypothetical protein
MAYGLCVQRHLACSNPIYLQDPKTFLMCDNSLLDTSLNCEVGEYLVARLLRPSVNSSAIQLFKAIKPLTMIEGLAAVIRRQII